MLTHVHKCWKLGGVNTFAQGMKKGSEGIHWIGSNADAMGIGHVRWLTLGAGQHCCLHRTLVRGVTRHAVVTIHHLTNATRVHRTLGTGPDAVSERVQCSFGCSLFVEIIL